MSQPLRYGQIISLKPADLDHMFVISDGHIKTKAQIFEIKPKKVASGTLFFQSLFQIYPQFQTSKIDQALKLEHELKKDKYKGKDKSYKIKEMEEKVFQEYKQNIETAEKNKDQPFTMAQSVQFLHLSSNKFLASNYYEAEEEKENFKLELNEYPSENTCFRMLSAYIHQTRTDGLIYADEPLFIIMDKIYLGMKPYLHVGESIKRCNNHLILASRTMFNFPNAKALQRKIISGQAKTKLSRNDINDLQEPNTHLMLIGLDYKKKQDLEQIQNAVIAESIEKREINVSLEKKSPFQISVFCNPEEDENKIYFGDVIWLHHIELNAILVTNKAKTDELFISLQQTKNDQLGEFIGNTNGMWYIESLNMKGGPVEWGQIFRLRHFSLGRYLAVQKEYDRDGDMNSCFYLEEKCSDNSLLQFSALPSSINENQKYVTKDAFFKLKNGKKWIQFIDKHHNQESEQDLQIVMLRLSDNCKDDDVLKCYKATLNEIQETSFLVSCFPIMRKTLSIVTDLATKDQKKIYQDKNIKFPKKIEQIKKVLLDLTRFCSNQFLISSQNRQKVLKEQFFIDILLEILCSLSNEREIQEYMELTRKRKHNGFLDTFHHQSSKLIHAANQVKGAIMKDFGSVAVRVQADNDNKLLRQFISEKFDVIKMIYQLLICICKDNNQNEQYVYKRVHKFQYQAKFFNETTDFIISLLKNNEQLLQNLTEETRLQEQQQRKQRNSLQSKIEFFSVNNLKDSDNIVLFYKKLVEESSNSRDYIEFFRTICKYNYKGLSVNQETIFKKCQENPKFNNSLFWTITCSENILLVEKSGEKKAISQLNKDELDYFVSQLRLYSDLALSRNFQWKGILEQKFPKQYVFQEIFNQNLDADIRSALCNIALTVYIDHEPLHLQIVPNLCRLVNQQAIETAIRQQQDFHDHDIFKHLISQVMSEISCYQQNQQQEIKKLVENKKEFPILKKVKSESQLQLDIIKLAKILIQFDVVNLIAKKEEEADARVKKGEYKFKVYMEILQPLINFLEYDKNNLILAYIMNIQREEARRRAQNSNKIISTVKGMVTGAIDIGRTLVNVGPKKKQALEEEFAEQTLFSKHPITSSLLTITSKIQSLNTEKGEDSYHIDIELKLEVCELLIFFQELRLDFLITNFLAFYALKQRKKSSRLKQEIEFDLLSVLPPTLRTGIEEPVKQNATNIVQWMIDILSKMGSFLNKRFANYTKELEMPDLDTLMSGNNKELVQEAVLPSLLIVFHNSTDCKLLDKVVEVIRRCYSQKLELFEKMRDLEILFEQTETNCYQKMGQLLAILRTLTESSEVWINNFHNKQTDLKGKYIEPKELGEVQMITKDLDSLLHKHTTVTPQLEIITQDHFLLISTSRQKVFNFLNGHTPLINFLRDSQNQLCDFLKDTTGVYRAEWKNTVLDLLKTIYQCLTNFCKNNRQNQNLLASHFELFVDEIEIDFGQTVLLCAIYEDNKFLCENISEKRIKDFLSYIKDYGRQSRFLDLLKVIQICQSQSLVENQLKILSLLLPHQKEEDKKQHEYFLWGQFTKDSKGIEFNFSVDGQVKGLHQPFKYHCKIIDLLLQTTQGEESYKLNTPKLKQVFSLGYLLNLVSDENDCFLTGYYANGIREANQLKIKLILFINWIYIQNNLTQQEVMIREQVTFNKLFNREKERFSKLETFPDREEYFKYFFDHLVPLFGNFANKIYGQEKSQRDDNYDVLKEILELIQGVSETILFQQLSIAQYNSIVKLYKPFEDSSTRMSMNFTAVIKEQHEVLSSNKKSQYEPLPDLMKSSLKKNQIMTIFNQKDKPFLTDQFKLQQTPEKQKPSKNKFSLTSQQLWVNKPNWFLFLDICEQSNVLQTQIKFELHTLANAIYNIDKIIPDSVKKTSNINLDFRSFLKKYIKFVEQGIIKKAGKKNLIYSLQLLEELLNVGDLEEMQNLFDQQNATRMLLNIIADYKNYPFDDDFFDQLLSFGCKLLEGGNQKVQKTLFNYFSTYSRSEHIFSKLNMVISDHIEEMNMKYKLQNEIKKEEKQPLLILETEPVAPQEQASNDSSQELQSKQKLRESILIHVLRFVQLFCEGHNLELQNYIRQQFNSRNNYNFVQNIIELLYTYHQELNNENYENILRCLDTLAEFVQGPCFMNQQTIIDSKFLEVANQLLATEALKSKQKEHGSKSFVSDEQSVQKNSTTNLSVGRAKMKQYKSNRTNIKRYMLERIKYKVMVLVSSLLELNSDSLAVKRIMRSLPIEILKKNLTSIYKRHKKLYGINYTQEALKHVFIQINQQIDKDPEDSHEKPEYHEVILETGFYIYFLILYYYELDTQEIDQETSTELQKAKTSMFDKNLFMDSLIGQLFTFAFAIIGGVLTTINQAKNYLQKAFEKIGQKLDQAEIDKKNQKQKEMNQEIFRETIQFFAYNSAHIEVVRNNQIERIQFFKPPYCKYLPKERKKDFHETVNRDSTNSKISDLIEQTDSIIQVCKHEEQLAVFFSKNKFIAIFANYVILWKDLAFILTLLLNLFIIISYSDPDTYTTKDLSSAQLRYDRISYPQLINSSLTVEQTQSLFFVCGIVMIVCSTFVVLFFLLKKAPLYIKEAYSKQDLSEYGVLINSLFQIFLFVYCIARVILNIEVLYYLTYGTLAFIATFVHPFFFAFHLTEIVIRFPQLRNIIKSFWEPKISLLLTFILIILFNYFFTLIAYVYFYDDYDNKCNSLLYCFLETFDKAFKNNGGIGGWLNQNQPQDPSNYNYGRFFFDNLYNIIIVIVMIQIFSGIIIDTFSSLREKQMQRDQDIQETCFICGFSRELFDRKSESGFKLHTQYEHYMWNYVFYISYLNDKESTEYTGIESYIADKLKDYDNSWIPINKAMVLKNMVLETQHHENEKIRMVQTEMDHMRKTVFDITKATEELNIQIQNKQLLSQDK